jgi:DNA primase
MHTVENRAAELKDVLSDPEAVCLALGLDEDMQPVRYGVQIHCPSPVHADRNPSCSVFTATDRTLRFHCHACKAHGDVLDLVALAHGLKTEGPDFPRVLQLAADLARDHDGAPTGATREAAGRSTRASWAGFEVLAEVLLELSPLHAEPDAFGYVKQRNVMPEALEDGWGGLPADVEQVATLLEKLGAACGREALAQSGLLTEHGLAWPEHRLLIPWRGPDGRLHALQRRLLGSSGDAPRYVSVTGSSFACPYGIDRSPCATPTADIVFVEGAIDVLVQRQEARARGLDRLVLGLPGVAGWRSSWATLSAGRSVAVALDADSAGHGAASRIQADLIAAGAREVVRVIPVRGKDWAEQWRERHEIG